MYKNTTIQIQPVTTWFFCKIDTCTLVFFVHISLQWEQLMTLKKFSFFNLKTYQKPVCTGILSFWKYWCLNKKNRYRLVHFLFIMPVQEVSVPMKQYVMPSPETLFWFIFLFCFFQTSFYHLFPRTTLLHYLLAVNEIWRLTLFCLKLCIIS